MSDAPTSLPDGLLLTFYGDDFTGSSASMEVTAFAGLPTVLFLDTPTPARLAPFAAHRVIGVAGISRSQSPAWMDAHLPPVFQALRRLNAPIAHYKVCSTFDSSPSVGSIGRAIDLAVPILGGSWHPLIVAAADMGRYQAFGNLFATVGPAGYRLDRHPTMSRHPVTPMHEADLGRHLAAQTEKRVGLVDLVAIKRGEADAALARERQNGAEIVSIDVLDDETLRAAGRLVWENRGERLFAIGSQGVQQALVAYWREAGLIGAPQAAFRAPAVDRIVVVSGSCSPVTAGQIAWAERAGFRPIRLDATRAVDPHAWTQELGAAAERALAALSEGADPIVYTAAGPDDPAVGSLREAVETSGADLASVNDRIGAGLGEILDRVVRRAHLPRAVISGGDTSGHATLRLGVYALTAIAPLAPGSPLCRAYGDGNAPGELELALKGGQVGRPDFFGAARNGGPSPA
ncbi:MAG: four-carbon acid sugar kinase family protein [Acetobacteraceae bacterium]|nr:four-carbon acid sugar kinase family protein [Acetobacteraceae bacterium]